MIMYYQTKFGSKRISSSEDRYCHILIIWAFAVTSTLKIAHQFFFFFFCMTLQLTVMHGNSTFGNKIFGSIEDIIWINIDIQTLRYDFDREYSIPIFSQNTLVYNDVSSVQVWVPRNQQLRRCSRKSHNWIISALTVTLTLTSKIANIFFFPAWHSGSRCCITIPSLVTKCLWFRRQHPYKHSLTFWIFAVTLTLNAVTNFFFTEHSGLWYCSTKPSLVANEAAV